MNSNKTQQYTESHFSVSNWELPFKDILYTNQAHMRCLINKQIKQIEFIVIIKQSDKYRICVCHFNNCVYAESSFIFDVKCRCERDRSASMWRLMFVKLFKSSLTFLPMVLLGSRGSEVRTGSVGLDGRPTPAWLTAQTLNWYIVFSFRPVTGYWDTVCVTSLQRSHFPTPISHLPETEERHTWDSCYKQPWCQAQLPGNHLQHSKNTIATS